MDFRIRIHIEGDVHGRPAFEWKSTTEYSNSDPKSNTTTKQDLKYALDRGVREFTMGHLGKSRSRIFTREEFDLGEEE